MCHPELRQFFGVNAVIPLLNQADTPARRRPPGKWQPLLGQEGIGRVVIAAVEMAAPSGVLTAGRRSH